MKNLLHSLLFLFLSTAVFAQEEIIREEPVVMPEKNHDPNAQQEEEIMQMPDQKAEFVGGDKALLSFLQKNMRYPQDCMESNIQGRVYVSFVVEKDGSLSQVEIARKMQPSLDNEAIRVIKLMPNWVPAQHEGKIVRSRMYLPISFYLE